MGNKRYAIVRVDIRCPFGLEEIFCSKDCHRCRLGYGYYGDTKKQLIMKVAQKIFEDKNRNWINTFGKEYLTKKYINMNRKESLKLAKEIVEFLGVEE